MSAENILKNIILNLELDIPHPQLSSPDYDIRQIKALINETGRELVKRADWPELFYQHSWKNTKGSLPRNFERMVNVKALTVDPMLLEEDKKRFNEREKEIKAMNLDEHSKRQVLMAERDSIGVGDYTPVFPLNGEAQRNYVEHQRFAALFPRLFYHLTERKPPYLNIFPNMFTPDKEPRAVAILYISKNWVAGGKDEVTQNGDEPLLPEHLIEKGALWRWKRNKGMPFEDIRAEFEADLKRETLTRKIKYHG